MKKARTNATAAAKVPGFLRDRRWVYLIPILGALWVWLSSLSFVPVPWPDDSAFYFPAKDLFAWPPRWVMIPQAPFEPSYREWNFNTMPLFPILIGLLRSVGILGSHALKILPLGGWILGILFVLRAFRRSGASALFLVAAAGVLAFDPILRWSSVLIRPESLIGAMGLLILFGTRFGWPELLRERKFFHPVSLCLLVAAMLHFNAIHLVPLAIVLYATDWRKILKIGALTAAGLIPWAITIAMKPALFAEQMQLQFDRLGGYRNPWLSSFPEFMKALLADMGTPEPWASEYSSAVLIALFALPLVLAGAFYALRGKGARERLAVAGAFAWLVSALYLWHTKAEVWFTHYFHLAYWALVLLVLWELPARARRAAFALPLFVGALFLYGQIAQTARLESSRTWHWDTYEAWIDCIDRRLVEEHAKRGSPEVFRVWDPTYPDITLALSKRHPTWEFTRTNDFYQRADLAVKHGYDVDAMVVTEIFRPDEQFYDGELAARPGIASVWMHWDSYFLNRLERDPAFKPRRFLCQDGRWDAFLYLKD